MKKILAAFDGLKYSESTAAYALDIASRTNSKVIAVFLEDFTYHSYKMVDIIGQEYVEEQRVVELNRKDSEIRDKSVALFKNACVAAGVEFSIHRDKNIAIRELVHESVYSDLLIIENDETLTHYTEDLPTRFVRTLLEMAECPVLLVPPEYQQIRKVIFMYDGASASVYAIKKFGCLMDMEGLAVDVVCVRKNRGDKVLPDSRLIKEWFGLHYPNANFHVYHGDQTSRIDSYLADHGKDSVVVLGAYARGSISRMLQKSTADMIMQNLDVPLFVAHR